MNDDLRPDLGGRDVWVRRVGMLLGAGVGVAIVVAVLVAIGGGTGRAGAAVLLLVLALTCAVSAMTALVSAVVDEFRDRPVARVRVVLGGVLFVAAAALMAMTVAAGG